MRKRHILGLFATFVAVFGLATAFLGLVGTSVAAPGSSRSEAALLREMNRVRALHDLRPLRLDPILQRAARAHSLDMLRRQYFAHGAFARRMVRFGAKGPVVGENLAWGVGPKASARQIVAQWLASPLHRRNLLRAGFRGVGLASLPGTFRGYRGARVVTADFSGI